MGTPLHHSACVITPAWVIRHKPTGEFMPCRMSRCGLGGWSHWQPGSSDKPFDANMRIFWTEQAARNALTMWVAGPWLRETHKAGGWDEVPYDEVELVPGKPLVPRARWDMEVVPIEVRIP